MISNQTAQFRSVLNRYKDESIIFLSSVLNARYCIQSVDDLGVFIQRLDANEPQRLTFDHFEEIWGKIREAGSSLSIKQLDSTSASKAAVLQAPFLALSSDRKTIVDVSSDEQALNVFCEWLEKLRVAFDQ